VSIKKIKPSLQGHLDGACGFYAVVNALQAIEPDFDARELFTQAIKAHLKDGNPMSFVEGTMRGSIKNVLSRVIDYIHENYELTDKITKQRYYFDVKIPFWHNDKERSRKDVLSILQKSDYSQGTVCIVGYQFNDGDDDNAYAHWSVIRSADEKSLKTLDSSKEKVSIEYDEIRVDSMSQVRNSSRPYNIISADIFVISRIFK
jgi:hypothetical protein